MMALEALRLVARFLPAAVKNGKDSDAREGMAWADTLAGLSIANAGVSLPHGIGMAIGGMYPHVMHGEALAVVYPAVMRHTWRADVSRFARLARAVDPAGRSTTPEADAERCVDAIEAFLDRIGMRLTLAGLRVPREELPALARQSLVLPDYKNHPKVVDIDEVEAILAESFGRSPEAPA
jgi:alcohol dehydrogenase class IV